MAVTSTALAGRRNVLVDRLGRTIAYPFLAAGSFSLAELLGMESLALFPARSELSRSSSERFLL